MRLLKLIATRRKHRRYAVVALAAAFVVATFGVSFVAAQESRNFMPWFNQANGGGALADRDTILRTSMGQAVMGRSTSDDFEVVLGFHTGVLAGAPAFAARVQELALTPLPTSTSTPPPTRTPESADATATAETVGETATPDPVVEDTPTPEERPTSTAVPPTQTPALPGTPGDLPTTTPVVIVVTSVPEPGLEPEATATPYIIVVTAPPSDVPTPEPPSGGACGLPANNGPIPLDLGMIMLLVAPLMLWRIGFKP